jgi:hypothetical protein
MPSKRVRVVSGRWTILHSHLLIPIPRSTVPSPAMVAVMEVLTQHLLNYCRQTPDWVSRLYNLCFSMDSGVVHNDFNPLSTTHGHSVASTSHDINHPARQFNHTLFLLIKIKLCAHYCCTLCFRLNDSYLF